MCLSEGEPYIRRPQKPSGPNLLDEPLKGFIVYPVCSPFVVFWGLANPKEMGNMTHSESVQPLQSVKLEYQPCSRSRAAMEPLWNRLSLLITCLCYSLIMFTLIMCFTLGL